MRLLVKCEVDGKRYVIWKGDILTENDISALSEAGWSCPDFAGIEVLADGTETRWDAEAQDVSERALDPKLMEEIGAC